jgi:gluconate 5-dehydrogenase
MAARGQGRLVFISSMVGPQSFQGDPAYPASKGGLEALMRALAVELGDKGITANAIAPGFFMTDVNAALFAQPRAVELARWPPTPRPTSPARCSRWTRGSRSPCSGPDAYLNRYVIRPRVRS